MNVGYYPIKEKEIKEIIKMVALYNKGDIASIDKILAKNKVDETLKEVIYAEISEGVQSKDSPSFNESFGICIAKIQDMYRDSYNFRKKSITKLFKSCPKLDKYKANMAQILMFKNNKYKFLDELSIPNSCGIYITSENVKKILNDYNTDSNIKKAIDNFYGDMHAGFIEVLEYCIENECGLLEADYVRKEGNIISKEVEAELENKEIEHECLTEDKEIVGAARKTWSILGYRFLWEIISILIMAIMVTILYLLNIDSFPIKIAVSIVTCLITTIIIWEETIRISFKKKIIAKQNVNKLMVGIVFIVLIFVAINLASNYFQYKVIINHFDASNVKIKYYNMLIEKEKDEEQKQKYVELMEDVRKAAKEEYLPYYIVSCISNFVINLGVLPCVKKRIKKAIE